MPLSSGCATLMVGNRGASCRSEPTSGSMVSGHGRTVLTDRREHPDGHPKLPRNTAAPSITHPETSLRPPPRPSSTLAPSSSRSARHDIPAELLTISEFGGSRLRPPGRQRLVKVAHTPESARRDRLATGGNLCSP